MNKKAQWGGQRKGAGRPRQFSAKQIRRTVTLPAEYVAELERLGDGNLSRGIRRLIEASRS